MRVCCSLCVLLAASVAQVPSAVSALRTALPHCSLALSARSVSARLLLYCGSGAVHHVGPSPSSRSIDPSSPSAIVCLSALGKLKLRGTLRCR